MVFGISGLSAAGFEDSTSSSETINYQDLHELRICRSSGLNTTPQQEGFASTYYFPLKIPNYL